MPNNDYGLVEIIADGVLENISAYALPYCDDGRFLHLRIRTVHKDFVTSEPDLSVESDWMYDKNMFSGWESENIGTYYNLYGFGKPQPDPPTSFEEENPDSGEQGIIVQVIFPPLGYNSKFSFSYDLINNNTGYSEVYRENMVNNLIGLGKSIVTPIGNDGGFIEVFATCTNILTDEYCYSNKIVEYSASDKYVYVYFDDYDFDILNE